MSSTFAGNPDGGVTGICPAPPPPPPPPPVPGQVPAMRINTAEAPTIRRMQIVSNDGYEPPAAIQNAMLTKDKKPFTYTPGMGGKLDLSQIRSPRMARRVAKNANDEGIEGPPKSALEPKPTPAQNAGPNLFIQPQVAVPVFPTNVPPQASNRIPSTPPANRTPPTPPANRTPTTPPLNKLPVNGTVAEKQPEPVKNTTKVETKVAPIVLTSVQPGSPEGPSTPTQVTLTKAPTPWLQNKNKPQEELPEWAKRSSMSKQSSTSPDSPTSPPAFTPVQQAQQPQWQQVQQRQQPQQYQYQPPSPQLQLQLQQQPQQFNQQPQKRTFAGPTVTQSIPQTQERVIPIRVEDRPSVFDVKHEPGHHQLKQPPSTHHQQRWGQAPVQNQVQAQQQQPPTQPQPSTGGAYIIPIMIENSDKRVSSGPGSNASYAQPATRNSTIENQPVKIVPQRGPVQVQPAESGPLQSRSFRVLQKITDSDLQNDVDPEQLRKLQLSEDDRILMNKFKEQVDNDTFLHQEEDPRYRGAAIPSRAFRFLQTMTDAGESPVPTTNVVPRGQSAINKKQNRNSKSFEETQASLPPSEQQAPEPKKYMGSAIPSRSFRILQAMTAPETVATQENRQADYTCQTENNVPGNQQGVFMSPCPPPQFWAPEGGWWGYYPLPYPGVANDAKYNPYPYPQDGTAYIYYPIYNQNYTGYPPQCAQLTDAEKNAYANVYPQYVIPAPLQNNPIDQTGNGPCYGQIVSNNGTGPTDTVMSMVKKIEGNKPQKETNNLSPPQWNENVSRAVSSESNKDSDCTTAMNTTDEEEIPERVVIPKHPLESQSIENSEKSCASSALNLNVPNYTYIDVSDSSDSSDSESHSANESVVESSKSSCNAIDNTSSDSDDSDSYLAYSTGLNPHGRQDQNADRTAERTDIEKESCMEKQELGSSSERINGTDCDSDLEEQIPNDTEKSRVDQTYPPQLSVIYEDGERGDSESPRPQDNNKTTKWSGKPFEATDDPPDGTDTTTVSVSLPLRFKFSVSENNEDVTTVIVGDSTIKPEKRKDEVEKSQEHRTEEKVNDVSVDFQIVNDTTVDFTIKKQSTESKRKTKSHTMERTHDEAPESKTENEDDTDTPHVNFTLKKNPRRLSRINCEETIETEYTIRSRKVSTRKEEARSEKDREEHSADSNASINASERITITTTKEASDAESTSSNKIDKAIHDVNRDKCEKHNFTNSIVKPEVIVSECTWSDDSDKVPTEHEPNEECNTTEGDQSQYETESEFLSKQKHDDDRQTDMEDKAEKEQKHLLSVQNSREETDDEDSGVTSDMSRIISEVDTDSECASTKNIKKYQRTQTHSRLFRLLHDDSTVPEDTEKSNSSPFARREYLSLPLKPNSFSYDENYCSNYSSGVTSPEYSPVCEQSWKRLHETENGQPEQNSDDTRSNQQERLSCKEDPYYQAWKTSKSPPGSEQDIVPSLAFKILESRRPLWAYRVNVLCPRIKSTKSVPQALRASGIINESSNPVNSSYVTVKTDRC